MSLMMAERAGDGVALEVKDLVVLVPKDDEMRALAQVFEFVPTLTRTLPNSEKAVYETTFNGLSIAFVLILEQGNAAVSQVLTEVLGVYSTRLVFLVGTAAGRENRLTIGSVVAAENVLDITERSVRDDGASFRPRDHEPPAPMRRDIGKFIGSQLPVTNLKARLRNLPANIAEQVVWDLLDPDRTVVELDRMASGNDLVRGDRAIGSIWDLDDRVRFYEMEAAGFGLAAKAVKRLMWMVIRGISDYGTEVSKRDGNREAAAFVAAGFLRDLLETEGALAECHPRSLVIPESVDSSLSESQFFAASRSPVFFSEAIRTRLGATVREEYLKSNGTLTLKDLAALCTDQGVDKGHAIHVLNEIRAEYFTKKYLDYTYASDIRSQIPAWHREVSALFKANAVDIETSRVLDVGIGNGLEGFLFEDAREFVGIDLSMDMLDRARVVCPSLIPIETNAETLAGVDPHSVDVYVALRTYQSRFFDIPRAVRQAFHVLRPGGFIVVSISNGYLDGRDGEPRVIRGLRVPEGDGVVDRDEPFKVAEKVRHSFDRLGFEAFGTHYNRTDIYLWAFKPLNEETLPVPL